eukprot:760575-Pleurochrysis_carterae.AAC.1
MAYVTFRSGRVASKLTRLPKICDRGVFLSAEFSLREKIFRQFSTQRALEPNAAITWTNDRRVRGYRLLQPMQKMGCRHCDQPVPESFTQ